MPPQRRHQSGATGKSKKYHQCLENSEDAGFFGKRVRWDCHVSPEDSNEIKFEHTGVWGKRSVIVNTNYVINRKRNLKLVGIEEFSFGSPHRHQAMIRVEPRGLLGYRYSLFIDGVPYGDFLQYARAAAKTSPAANDEERWYEDTNRKGEISVDFPETGPRARRTLQATTHDKERQAARIIPATTTTTTLSSTSATDAPSKQVDARLKIAPVGSAPAFRRSEGGEDLPTVSIAGGKKPRKVSSDGVDADEDDNETEDGEARKKKFIVPQSNQRLLENAVYNTYNDIDDSTANIKGRAHKFALQPSSHAMQTSTPSHPTNKQRVQLVGGTFTTYATVTPASVSAEDRNNNDQDDSARGPKKSSDKSALVLPLDISDVGGDGDGDENLSFLSPADDDATSPISLLRLSANELDQSHAQGEVKPAPKQAFVGDDDDNDNDNANANDAVTETELPSYTEAVHDASEIDPKVRKELGIVVPEPGEGGQHRRTSEAGNEEPFMETVPVLRGEADQQLPRNQSGIDLSNGATTTSTVVEERLAVEISEPPQDERTDDDIKVSVRNATMTATQVEGDLTLTLPELNANETRDPVEYDNADYNETLNATAYEVVPPVEDDRDADSDGDGDSDINTHL